jgi:hypothetical protein
MNKNILPTLGSVEKSFVCSKAAAGKICLLRQTAPNRDADGFLRCGEPLLSEIDR